MEACVCRDDNQSWRNLTRVLDPESGRRELAPRALAHLKPGATPQGKVVFLKRALKARVKAAFASIPHIAFVEVDAVFAQKVAILLLKTTGAMVLFLTLNIFENGIKLTWAH